MSALKPLFHCSTPNANCSTPLSSWNLRIWRLFVGAGETCPFFRAHSMRISGAFHAPLRDSHNFTTQDSHSVQVQSITLILNQTPYIQPQWARLTVHALWHERQILWDFLAPKRLRNNVWTLELIGKFPCWIEFVAYKPPNEPVAIWRGIVVAFWSDNKPILT